MQPAGFDGWFTLEYTCQQILSTQANGDGKAIMCGDVWGGQPGQLIQQSFRPGSDPAQTVFFGPAGLGFCVVHPPDPNKTLGRGLPFWERYTNRFNLKAVKCMVAGPNLHSHLGQRGQDQLQQLNPRSHPAQRNKHRTIPHQLIPSFTRPRRRRHKTLHSK